MTQQVMDLCRYGTRGDSDTGEQQRDLVKKQQREGGPIATCIPGNNGASAHHPSIVASVVPEEFSFHRILSHFRAAIAAAGRNFNRPRFSDRLGGCGTVGCSQP